MCVKRQPSLLDPAHCRGRIIAGARASGPRSRGPPRGVIYSIQAETIVVAK